MALIQRLTRKGEASDLVADHGHLVVDECHHLSAASFELLARRSKARFVLDLSATIARKDGHHPIIFMQCGPVRYRVDARTQATERGILHRARHRSTAFQLPAPLASTERPSMSEVYAALALNNARNDLIFDDVLKALEAKRSPIILTERKDHLEYLKARFSPFVKNLAVLRGGMSVSDGKIAEAALLIPDDQERLILETGGAISERVSMMPGSTHYSSPFPSHGRGRLPNMSGDFIASTTERLMFLSSIMSMTRYQFSQGWLQNAGLDIRRSAISSSR